MPEALDCTVDRLVAASPEQQGAISRKQL